MKHLYYLMSLMLCFQFAIAQQAITGSVTDDQGIPLPGATVIETGTDNGTLTDFDGNFTITVGEDSSLSISYIGYISSTLASDSDFTSISLTQSNQLEEVVVTSLGISRDKKSLGYSVSTVGGDDIAAVKDANFLSSMQGKVAGLNIKSTGGFGGSANVVIRGNSSLYGNNQALFIVDGTPISNDINNSNAGGRGGYDFGNGAMDINPDDIETVSVLKGAAATALYGSRGSNGVIVITTKKGNNKEKGIGVTVSSSFTSGSINLDTAPRYQNEYGAGYGPYYSGPDSGFGLFDVDGDGNDDLTTVFTEDASYGSRFDPTRLVYQWDSQWPQLDNYKVATPYVAAKNTPNDLYQTASTFINNVSIQGADDKGSYRISFTNLDSEGIVPNSKLKRNTISLNSSYNITDRLKASTSVNLIKTDGKGRNGTGYDSRNLLQSHRQWWQVNVDPLEQIAVYQQHKENMTWNSYNWDDTDPIYFDNIGWTLFENYETDEKTRYYGNTNLFYQVNDWINILAQVSFDTSDSLIEERINVGSVDVSQYSRTNRSRSEFNYNVRVNFDKKLNDLISINGNIGANLREENYTSISASTNGGLNIRGLYTLANSANSPLAPSEYSYQNMVDGVFANASVGFDNTYFLEASLRRDRSSTLPVSGNKFVYPSLSGTMIFSELLNIDFLTFGKIRANYAEVGNDTTPYNVFSSYNLGDPFNGNGLASNPYRLNNLDLVAEITKSTEFGIEASLFNSRVNIDASFYNQTTEDLLTPVDVSTSTGVGAKWLNAGSIKNSGIELMLSVIPIKSQDFNWNISGTWSNNKSEVLELAEGLETLSLGSFQGGVSIHAVPGQPYGAIRGRAFQRHSNGQRLVGANGRYLATDLNNEIIGNQTPDWNAGIRNTMNYKDVSFSFLIDIQEGGDFFSLDTYYGYATGIYDLTAGLNELGNPKRDLVANGGGVIMPGVNASGAANTIRAENNTYANPFGYKSTIQEQHVWDASYAKLREIRLSYDIPTSLFDNLIESASLSLIGKNLWIISKNSIYSDPEFGLSAGNITGYQSGAPLGVKEIGASLKLQF
jgi:TonB-linked SusC/RagA family outer membrane protein